jgi:hypothetical protein
MADGPPRSAGQLGWLFAAACLVGVLLIGGGALAWHAWSSAPPEADEPATPVPVAEQVAFGAPEVIDGVPWGFPHTAEGAASAAATAVSVTGHAQAVFDADRFAQIAEVVFAPDEATAQIREVDSARVQFEVSGFVEQPPSRRMYHFAPLAVRPVVFDAEAGQATVEVWAMTLVGVGDRGGAVFTTSTVELATHHDSWQVVALDSEPGPTPMVEESPTVPGRTRGLVRDALQAVLLPTAPSP